MSISMQKFDRVELFLKALRRFWWFSKKLSDPFWDAQLQKRDGIDFEVYLPYFTARVHPRARPTVNATAELRSRGQANVIHSGPYVRPISRVVNHGPVVLQRLAYLMLSL